MKKVFLLFAVLLGMSLANAQNVITDGDFSTTTSITPYTGGVGPANIWCSMMNTGTEAYATVDAGVCVYQVISGGSASWELQLMQWGFPITNGNFYRLSFDVMADYDTWFGVFLGEDGGSWYSILGYENYYQFTTNSWTTITLPFQALASFDYHKLSFEFGGQYYNTFRFDNIMLEDLGPFAPIGILGTAVNGWDVDVDMLTTDGVIYTLTDYPLLSGQLKFRQNDNWAVNWGSPDFPTGIGYQNGPNIPVYNAGNYDITFNRETGEYSFICMNNCLPVISITGTAVPPDFSWEGDQQMSTSDGINYTLSNIYFNDGEAKFRQDFNSAINWGNSTFPSGTALPDGPAIPVTSGIYNVTFNLLSGEYLFETPVVSLIGSALSGWDIDVDMQTTDDVIYTLADYYFTYGEVKFRFNHSWETNWGGYEFPSGWAWLDGPNIPVMEGNYDVTFNRNTGEYSFVATDCPVPGIQCPSYLYVGTDWGTCGATVYYPDVVPAPNCGGEGITIVQTAGLPSGSFFPIGNTVNEFLLTNAAGETTTCSFEVYVYDSEPPTINGLSDYFEPLWPPNHQMVHVPVDYQVADLCGNTYSELWVYSNEPENGLGDGDLYPDIEIIDNHNVMLRAERSGTGTGREYHIVIYAWDDAYNSTYSEVVVLVPHDMGHYRSEVLKGNRGSYTIGKGNTDPVEISASKVLIWPDPSDNVFNMKAESGTSGTMDVYVTDFIGNKVLKLKLSANETITFGDQLSPGMYFVRTIQGGQNASYKIIKH